MGENGAGAVTALCTVSYCPAPSDPDWHRCFVCQNNTIEHHHVKSRGMGGSKERRDDPLNVVALCHFHHEMVTLHECSDDILDLPRGLTYVYFDLHGKTVVERVLLSKEESDPVLSAAAEGGADEGAEALLSRGADDPQPPPPQPSSAAAPSAGLTHEQRVAIAQDIKNAEWNRQWIAGDTGNAWIAELGEEAEQYLSDFGYVHESLANILRVCAAIPPPYRNGNLRYSHHVVVYQLLREDQVLRLKECEDEGWSVAEFRRQVHGPSKSTQRWMLEELLSKAEQFLNGYPEPPRSTYTEAIDFFLDWLGEQR
jgi:hypothetical protein